MTDLRTAAQQALDTLELIEEADTSGAKPKLLVVARALYAPAIAALKAALAEPTQEPVAWMVYTLDGKSVCVTDNPADFTDEHRVLPLYTAPPQRKPLTEEEIKQIAIDTPIGGTNFARAIERAHGIGGGNE